MLSLPFCPLNTQVKQLRRGRGRKRGEGGPEEALLKSSRQKNFEVMGGLVWQQFRYTPKSPKILGLWLADPEDNNNKQ